MVSVEACIMLAIIPNGVSGPTSPRRLDRYIRLLLPLIGLRMASGKSSGGNFRKEKRDWRWVLMSLRMVLFTRIFIAKTIARMVGNRPSVILRPSFTPSVKDV